MPPAASGGSDGSEDVKWGYEFSDVGVAGSRLFSGVPGEASPDTGGALAGARGYPLPRDRGEKSGYGYEYVPAFGYEDEKPVEESFREQLKGFVESTVEMAREFGKGAWDIGGQCLAGAGELEVVRRMRGPASRAMKRLSFMNDFLPEDREPAHAWPIVAGVALLALLVLNLGSSSDERNEVAVVSPKKLYISPPNATRIQLPDGRSLSYQEQGVSRDRARFSMIVPHSFLSSRLAGIPGIKASLLEEFGARLVTYDLPGFGESDPHPVRNLSSSASDMIHLADALGINDKFWLVGYSGGGMHAWAALHYIPDRLAGVAMFAPMVNPYDPDMTKEERRGTWNKWTRRRKFKFFLARRFPSLLSLLYRQSFLSGKQGDPEKWMSVALGKKDKSLLEEQFFKDFWDRDVAEAVRQGNPRPFMEEAKLQVSDWGFTLSDIQFQQQKESKGFLQWLKTLLSPPEREWVGFLGPIHIWQGTDDTVVPPAMTEYVRQVVPGATVHRLIGEGHFSYFCFCDDCHRQIFSTLFGVPQGPLDTRPEEATTSLASPNDEALPDPMTDDNVEQGSWDPSSFPLHLDDAVQ